MPFIDYKNSIPSLAIKEFLGEVNSQANMLALIGQKGDWCIRTDVSPNLTYIIIGSDPTQLSSWKDLPSASGALNLNGLSDVSIGSPSNGQILAYNGTEWINTAHTHAIADVTGLQTALNNKEGVLPLGSTSQYLRGDKTLATLDKTAVGLGNVDNTSDATKNTASATLQNKTMSGANNTFTNIPQSAVSNLTTDLASKQATITGGASTIVSWDLTANMALASNSSGKVVASTATSTELSYLSGVTSAIQTQLGNKQNSDSTLTALAGYNTSGLLTQTAPDTFTGRTLSGTAPISIVNGNGVSGNPTVELNQSGVTADGASLTPSTIVLSGKIDETSTTLASASTTNIGGASANYISISGTTTITALGTAQSGAKRYVHFQGALTLTHNATSLILPTSANITTATGDTATFISLGSGNWRCFDYQRASGSALVDATGGSSNTVYDIGTTSGTVTPNFSNGNWQILTANGNVTFANPTNMNNNGDVLRLRIIASGATRTFTIPTTNTDRFNATYDLLTGKVFRIDVERWSSTVYTWIVSEQSL